MLGPEDALVICRSSVPSRLAASLGPESNCRDQETSIANPPIEYGTDPTGHDVTCVLVTGMQREGKCSIASPYSSKHHREWKIYLMHIHPRDTPKDQSLTSQLKTVMGGC